jgi:23S rRNA (adenine-N6)-dimethyltransferase
VSGGGRSWDWYRLRPDWADRIVDTVGIRSGDLVVDLGAGDGALSLPLAAAGARVIAVELHPSRAEKLRRRSAGRDIRVVQMDGLEFRYPRRRVRVVANPPFGIAGRLLRSATAHPELVALDVVLPTAIARRWADGRSRPRRFRAEIALGLPRKAFDPRPAVDCVLLRLRRR